MTQYVILKKSEGMLHAKTQTVELTLSYAMMIQQKHKNRGFALIATMAIMSLVVLISVGSITLSKGVSKESNNLRYKHEAQSNARMALMIALGELQKELGPDQRISANMAVFAGNPETAGFDAESSNDGYENPHYLGVWNSWTTWLSGDNDPSEIAETYDRGRTSNFRKLLVSHPDSKNMSSDQWRDFAESGSGNLDTVALVSTGSLGPQGRDSDRVTAPLINTENGRYAWYVSGNNQKANVSLGKEERGDSLADSAASLSNVTANGLSEKLDNSLSNFPTAREDLDKVISTQSAALLASNPDQAQEYLTRNFHAFTSHSQSVLANVRKGGLKKDLNLLMELDEPTELLPEGATLPAPRTRIPYNNKIHPIRELDGYMGGVAEDLLTMHLPSWEKMSIFYKEYEQAGNPDTTDFVVDVFGTLGSGSTKVPILADIRYQIGRVILPDDDGDGIDDCWLTFSPMAVIWNPHNTTLRINKKLRLNAETQGFDIRIYGGDVEVACPQLAQWSPLFGAYDAGKGNSPAIWNPNSRMRITRASDEKFLRWEDSSYTGHLSNPNENGSLVPAGFSTTLNIPETTLKPGEAKIFSSPNQQKLNNSGSEIKNLYITLEEGYRPAGPNSWNGTAVKIDPVINSANNVNSTRDLEGVDLTDARIELRASRQTSGTFMAGADYRLYLNESNSNSDPFHSLSEVRIADILPLAIDAYGDPNGNAKSEYEDSASIIPNGVRMDTSGDILQFGFSLKGNQTMDKEIHTGKSFVYSSPFGRSAHLSTPNDKMRRMNQYTTYFSTGNGSNYSYEEDISNNNNAVIFAHRRNSSAPLLEVPVSPMYSIASFQTMRTDIATDSGWTTRDSAASGTGIVSGSLNVRGGSEPNPGLLAHTSMLGSSNVSYAIGNSFATPMIPADDIYFQVDEAANNHSTASKVGINFFYNGRRKYLNIHASSKHAYDHSFMLNDSLYDEWFCSTITDTRSAAHFSVRSNAKEQFENFANNESELPNQHLSISETNLVTDDMSSELFSGSSVKSDGFQKIAQYLMLNGGFNVNSTSTEAWKALFNGLNADSISYRNPDDGSIRTQSLDSEKVILSRFSLPSSVNEGEDEEDSASWHGVRYLTQNQIEKLAQECVRQVKLRGPFLNMADFVNRRLDPKNKELARCGALQAAIDWDEFNGNSPSRSDSFSINARFKSRSNMVDVPQSDDSFSSSGIDDAFPEAHLGSKWTAIPGYVIQGDLLKRIGNQITVRDDSFTIRAYGDYKDERGQVRATAYCEAVIQRGSSYIDPADDSFIASRNLTSEENTEYGRKMSIVSFRWLSKEEI